MIINESKINEGNGVSSNIPALLDNFLQDVAQMTGQISYNDIIKLGKDKKLSAKLDKIKKLKRPWEDVADDDNDDGVITVTTAPDAFSAVADALAAKGFETLSADVGMVPDAYTAVDKDTAAKVQKLIDRLEDNDDVQNVYHTAEYPEDFEME